MKLHTTQSGLAQHRHHSNTFSKIGYAIEYGVRKDVENMSKATHRTTGHNSVVRRNHGDRHYNCVLTSKGHLRPVHHNY